MAVANITSIVLPGKFDPNKDKWEYYKVQLLFALEAAGTLQSAQKRALFLSQCGKEAFSLIVSLLAPVKVSEVTFESIIVTLDSFFISTPHPVLETQKFYQRKQRPDESLTSYVAALRGIAAQCQFNDLNRRLAEQIVLGVRDGSLRTELLKIKISDLCYGLVIQRALDWEALQLQKVDKWEFRNANTSSNHRDTHEQSNGSLSGEPMDVNQVSTTRPKPCVHCTKRHASKCRFRNATCFNCQKKGHTKAACNLNKKQNLRVNECCECQENTEEEKSGESACEDNFGVYVVTTNKRITPYMVEVKINGISVLMEVDSGAARSILPHSFYKQNSKSLPDLKPCDISLKTWTNNKLQIQGEALVVVERGEHKVELPVIISCGSGPALLGRSWFTPLGIGLQINTLSEDVIEKFPRLFDDKMGDYCGPLVHIDMKMDAKPRFLRARPVPFPLRVKVNEELQRMMNDGIITPVKHSQWATPLRLVPKPDGSIRVCGDYRSTVNATCEADSYPLPTANEAFFQLAGSKHFTKLDLKHAYNQVKVDKETAEMLTLNTPLGLMRMNRLAFGVHAAPGIFQRMMVNRLAGIDGVACLLDDVVVSGATMREHDQRLEQVLHRIEELGLKLNKKKCVFAANRVTFLGYEIDQHGIHPLKEKIEEIADKQAPTDKRSLKAFLGLYNFYEKFIKDKATILQPLYRLLKDKVQWQWGRVEQQAFDKAKKLLTSDLTLVHYSLEREVMLQCDASEYGLGAVLVHKMDDGSERPVMMGSRTMQDHERRYAQIDKEALAIMFGLKKFRQYLLGRRFVICTDHKPLLGIFGRDKSIPELISSRMLRWALTLNTFDYEIQYRPGKHMGNADSLSRWPTTSLEQDYEQEEDMFLIEQSNLIKVSSKQIAKETSKDVILSKVKNFLLHGWPSQVQDELIPYYRRRDALTLSKECILWANRVIIPKSLQNSVLKCLHENHCGVVQTKMLARGYIWFPSLDSDIENMVSSCDACQLNRNNPPTTQHTWPAETRPWTRIHVDFMGPFMGKTFLIVIDSYSKWPILEIVPSMTSMTVIDILRRIFADHGLPEVLVSDNGLAFTSKEFQEFMERNYIKHITGAPYHPATNGQAERTVQTIKEKLKKQSSKLSWSERVAKVLFHMRTVPSTVTGKTPAELLFGRKFKTALSVLHPDFDKTSELEKEEGEQEGEERKKRKLNKGDYVLMRTYNQNKKWQRGVVMELVAPCVYLVRADDDSMHRRHIDQLLRTRAPSVPGEGAQAPPQHPDMQASREDASEMDSDNDSVIIPPPEEWAEIVGV